MTQSWTNFNDAEEQKDFDVIPHGTLAWVNLMIKPGGHNDPTQGWDGGWATRSESTGSVYLNCEFVVLEGKFVRRKVWSLIGLYSPKGPEWGNMGRAFVRGILECARDINPKDQSPEAQSRRAIHGFGDLNGLEFLSRITVENPKKGEEGDPKNKIQHVITPGDKRWYANPNQPGMAQAAAPVAAASSPPAGYAPPPAAAAQSAGTPMPAWAN